MPRELNRTETSDVMEHSDLSSDPSSEPGSDVSSQAMAAPLCGHWEEAGRRLERGQLSAGERRRVVEEASQHAEERDLVTYILPALTEDELQGVLETLLTRRLWSAVYKVLDRFLHKQVQPEYSSGQLDRFMNQLVTAEQWDCVYRLIRFARKRKPIWTIGETQLDRDLLSLVSEERWGNVGDRLISGVTESQRRWVIGVAAQRVFDMDYAERVLIHSDDDQRDEIVVPLATRGIWRCVCALLDRGVSPARRRWAVREVCQHAHNILIEAKVVPHVAPDQLEEIWPILVSRELWGSAIALLTRVASPSQRRWATEQACQLTNDWHIKRFILPFCADHQLHGILTVLVKRGAWQSVVSVLNRVVSPTRHVQAVHEACQHAAEHVITQHVLPHCADDQLDDVLGTLVARGLWRAVDVVLGRGASPPQHRWAMRQCSQEAEDEDFAQYILHHCTDLQLEDVVGVLAARGLWQCVSEALQRGVSVERHWWVVQEAVKTGDELLIVCTLPPEFSAEGLAPEDVGGIGSALQRLSCFLMCTWAEHEDAEVLDAAFWRYVVTRQMEVGELCTLITSLRRSRREASARLSEHLDWDSPLCDALYESVIHFVTETWLRGQGQHGSFPAAEIRQQARLLSAQVLDHVGERKSGSSRDVPSSLRALYELCRQAKRDSDRQNLIFGLHFIQTLTLQCYKRREHAATIDAILNVLTCVPVVPDVQSVALTVMLRHRKWDVIRRANLRGVWEQVRRRLLTAAMKQGQWSLVAQWANHTLYDDQSLAALEEAYTHKQWRAYLLLADHGLVEIELMRVHYRLARYASWDVVLEMFERGADMIECQEGIRPGKNLRLLDQKKDDNERRPRYVKLRLLAEEWEERMEKLQSLEAVLEKKEWCVALHEINRRHRRREIVLALRAALASRVWHVAIYLIRQGIGARLCDGLFSLMLSHRQWEVCRVLLEEGVDPQLALDALPQLMEQNQWTLVARLMEYDVGDVVRRQVMQQALDRREGSVVWQCIINMERDHLSVEERQELFHEAFNRENWQAVKPLVEVKDDTGIQHRDDALLESIEQHQWDVVDHCLLFRANINMLDEDNHTPMHRMARKDDWEAVEELTKRRGDPNRLDKDGMSVFHRVIIAEQWELAKMQVEYLADIHLHARHTKEKRTPLQMLIDARQTSVIQHTFMWSPEQWRGSNSRGETIHHVACLTGCTSVLYNLMARRVDPCAVTVKGHSALSYAVMFRDRPQRAVAECLTFGFSAHQARLTDRALDTGTDDVIDVSSSPWQSMASFVHAQRLLSTATVNC